ncbi:LINE-1 retrotransposable element ORF1 protein [Dissostichus eleginoides]|uniref:LINE-1 retrotransposable element ORF1 protein n=1 Tax=Dissostichus eleginoides TaxID=100907 RepID=A0AAD9CMC4_DISEL|nr:LINE-1 retrotransposable element ORF1 protein [Dissostichus eleginoides]
MQTEAKLTDLEGRSRRENVRIHGVKEGAEEGTASVIAFVEDLLTKSLELPSSTVLNIERAHRPLAPKPPNEAPPRSILVKISSYKMKEDVLKRAWQKKGFDFQGKRIQLDHDHAPEVLRKRTEYAEAKAALKGRNIRFQTRFPAQECSTRKDT